MVRKGQGWHGESRRHSKARRGIRTVEHNVGKKFVGRGEFISRIEMITYEQAREMATDILYSSIIAEHGQRVVSDMEDPYKPYIQEQNAYSMAGECFSVPCVGIGNLDMSYYREGWECENLTDVEVIADCVENGDMLSEIDELAERIMASWAEHMRSDSEW